MKGIVKIARIGTKIIEIFHWVGVVLMAAATACALAKPMWVKYFVGIGVEHDMAELNVYGYEILTPAENGNVDMKILFFFGIGGIMILSLVAMIFRNLYLVIKKAEETTPFQVDNIRMMKEIGIFSIAIPIVGLVMTSLCRLIFGVDTVETSVNTYGFTMGVIVLCLTEFFAYGAELEKDVEGLL